VSLSPDPLAAPATLDRLDHLRATQALDIQGHREATRFVTSSPSPAVWARLLDPAALALGATLIVASALYLVGWNWFDLPHAARVALSLLPMGIAGVMALWLGSSRLAGQISAIAAGALSLVPLLIVGLAYPSTASGDLLLTFWALTMLPWTIGARSPFAWLAQVVAAEAALMALIPRLLGGDIDAMWILLDFSFALHFGLFSAFVCLTALLAWRGDRSAPRWLPEVLSLFSLLLLAGWLCVMVFGVRQGTWLLRGPALLLFLALLSVQVLFVLGRVRLLPATAHALGLFAIGMAVLARLLFEVVQHTDIGVTLIATMSLSLCGIVGLVVVTVWLHLGWRWSAARARVAP